MFMLTIMPYRARNDRRFAHVMLINSGYTSCTDCTRKCTERTERTQCARHPAPRPVPRPTGPPSHQVTVSDRQKMTACTRARAQTGRCHPPHGPAAAVIQPEHDDDALLSPGETRPPPD